MHHRWILLLSLALLLVAVQSPVLSLAEGSDEPHATPWWVDFLGERSTLDGQPLPVGAVVRAYDPTGVLAGRTEVTLAGWYGLMPVYGDDLQSSEDEGAEEGDSIQFTIDGHPAIPMGPDPAVWSGLVRQVDLKACTLAGDFDCDCRVTVADLMRQVRSFGVSRGEAGYYPPFDRDGDEDIDSGDLQDAASRWRTVCLE